MPLQLAEDEEEEEAVADYPLTDMEVAMTNTPRMVPTKGKRMLKRSMNIFL